MTTRSRTYASCGRPLFVSFVTGVAAWARAARVARSALTKPFKSSTRVANLGKFVAELARQTVAALARLYIYISMMNYGNPFLYYSRGRLWANGQQRISGGLRRTVLGVALNLHSERASALLWPRADHPCFNMRMDERRSATKGMTPFRSEGVTPNRGQPDAIHNVMGVFDGGPHPTPGIIQKSYSTYDHPLS